MSGRKTRKALYKCQVHLPFHIGTVTSPIGLWTAVLKPRVRHFGRRHLVFLQPEVTGEGGAKYIRTLNKTFSRDRKIIINFNELKTHCERVNMTPSPDNALKHPLLYGLFDSKWDHNLLNEHHAVLKKT